jgi:hypothetical protein
MRTPPELLILCVLRLGGVYRTETTIDVLRRPLALPLILMWVSPLCREIGVLKEPWMTDTRLPDTTNMAFSGETVPTTSILRTTTVAPSVGAVMATCTVCGAAADPQPAMLADAVARRSATNLRERGIQRR